MDKQTLKLLGRAMRGLSPVDTYLPIEMQVVLLRLALAEARKRDEANDPTSAAPRKGAAG